MRKLSLPLRMQYFRLARRAIQEGRLSWLMSTAAKTVAVPFSHWAGRPLTGPLMANLVTTYRCNNACFMCDLPKPSLYKARGEREFDTDQLKHVVDEMAAIGVAGLSLTGGEPTVRGDCFEILAHGRRRGMHVHLNSNGYTLWKPERVEALLASGVDSMNFSLDGAAAATHDRLRNAPLGFDRIEKATALILDRRRRGKPTLTYTFVVGPENCDEVPAFVELSRRRGVNSVSFIPLSGCYQGAQQPDESRLHAMERAVDWLRNEKARAADPEFIDNSDAYLSLFPRAMRSAPSPLRCYVGYHHVLVDCYGNVYPCAIYYETGRAVGNVKETPLPELWHSEGYQRLRENLAGCTDCYWNCHTETNLLYQRPHPPAA